MAISLNNSQISKFRATNDVLKDFEGTVQVPVLVASNGSDLIITPLTYTQSDLENDSIELGGVTIPFSVSPRGGAKVYVGKLDDGSSVWVDLFGEFAQLRKHLEAAADAKEYVKMTDEQQAALSIELEDAVREPSSPENAKSFSYAYVSVQMSRKGRVLKVGGTTQKVEAKQAESVTV